jgi:hypothetical protein
MDEVEDQFQEVGRFPINFDGNAKAHSELDDPSMSIIMHRGSTFFFKQGDGGFQLFKHTGRIRKMRNDYETEGHSEISSPQAIEKIDGCFVKPPKGDIARLKICFLIDESRQRNSHAHDAAFLNSQYVLVCPTSQMQSSGSSSSEFFIFKLGEPQKALVELKSEGFYNIKLGFVRH